MSAGSFRALCQLPAPTPEQSVVVVPIILACKYASIVTVHHQVAACGDDVGGVGVRV